MMIVPKLNEAISRLRAGMRAAAMAELYRYGPPTHRMPVTSLHVVRTPVPPWRLVQITESSDGEIEVEFDLPDDRPAEVSELVAAYGEPDVEQVFDGPQIHWFRPPRAPGFLVGAAVRGGGASAGLTRSLRVVAPARRSPR